MRKILCIMVGFVFLLNIGVFCAFASSSQMSVKEALAEYEVQTGERIETNRYYFLMPNGSNGQKGSDPCLSETYEMYTDSWYNEYTSEPAVYWWEDCSVKPSSYPGFSVEKGDSDCVFYADVPKAVKTIVWNNNLDYSKDVNDLMYSYATQTIQIGCQYYDPGESFIYPDGTDSFDNMIYVLEPRTAFLPSTPSSDRLYSGEWYYYYGNGCYGTLKEGGCANCIRDDHFDGNGNHKVTKLTLGDVDKDNEVSIIVATEIQMVLAQLKPWFDVEAEAVADFDNDGEVSVLDATAIQLKLAGLE